MIQVPYYWGGTAGDAQTYNDGFLSCWVDNIMQNPMPPLDTGIPEDNWYVVGHLDKNLDLTGTTRIVISAQLNAGIKCSFSLSSGYTGVASTLKPDGKKYTKRVVMIGKGVGAWQDYTFNQSDFTGDSDFDWANVTAFEFFLDASLNAGNEAAFSIPDPCHWKIDEIRAAN
jgi:hypothetical protein